jgi:hypothetical protein
MFMIEFILFTFGLTQILLYGSIFDRIRPDWNLFKCPLCMGFHTGWFGYLFLYTISIFPILSLPHLFVYAFISAGINYVLDRVFDDDGIKIDLSKQ